MGSCFGSGGENGALARGLKSRGTPKLLLQRPTKSAWRRKSASMSKKTDQPRRLAPGSRTWTEKFPTSKMQPRRLNVRFATRVKLRAVLVLLSMMLLASAARANDDDCKKAHDPVAKDSKAPCTGVLVPRRVALRCANLRKKDTVTWPRLLKAEKDKCLAQMDGLKTQIEIEKKRTAAEKRRGDKHEASLKKLAEMPAQEEVPAWERGELWGPLGVAIGVVATVLIYEYVLK